jgi:DNA-binding NtrC family response regulator/NAD-dependent dihydropyrimidine dehydrogenase PreA subunit
MPTITTAGDRCKKTYSCVRYCPVQAIKIQEEQTQVSYERCVWCGDCVVHCSQKARKLKRMVSQAQAMLQGPEQVTLILDPTWLLSFPDITPSQLERAVLRLGFDSVEDNNLGIELFVRRQRRLLMEEPDIPRISPVCPAVVNYVEKHCPEAIPNLLPVVSPPIATARALRQRQKEAPSRIVYVGPCIALKELVQEEQFRGDIDAVLTFAELKELFSLGKVEPHREKSGARGKISFKPVSLFYTIGEGMEQLFGKSRSRFGRDIIEVAGRHDSLDVVRDIAGGRLVPRLAALHYCRGCMDGPALDSRLSPYMKREMILKMLGEDRTGLPRLRPSREEESLDLSRTYSNKKVSFPVPSRADVTKILHSVEIFNREDELNCGACGFRTCREKAVAIFQGLAAPEVCFPYSIRHLNQHNLELRQRVNLLRQEVDISRDFDFVVGRSKQMQHILDLAKKVAPAPTNVLIRGESGTGKELIAKAIHRHSKRADRPLISINCTALAETLLESELFGHVRGAFTGATAAKKGLFEEAHQSTLFLDEIGEISPELQKKLLRVIETGEFKRVGEAKVKRADVRLIAATNHNLEKAIEEGRFREDLYYRLTTLVIRMPPLREHKEDIPPLIEHFLKKACGKINKHVQGLHPEAFQMLTDYHWPGNVRELENVIERAVVLAPGNEILVSHLPNRVQVPKMKDSPDTVTSQSFREKRLDYVENVERNLIRQYLVQTKGNVTEAARLAGLPRRSFHRLLQKLNIHSKEFEK